MKALWLEAQARLREDIPKPEPGPGEALVKVKLAGICATDLELIAGYYPFSGILGHEFVGEIVASPDAPERVGERVVGEINIACGDCGPCLHAMPQHCYRRRVLGIKRKHGAFAEFLCLPLANLHRVADSVGDEKAVFVEPLAAALEILEQVWIKPEHQVLVIGAGRLGQLVARVLTLSGCYLRVVARYPRQQHLLQQAGVRYLSENAVPRCGFDRVIEATGSSAGFDLARRAIRPRGSIVLKSTYRGEVPVSLSSLVVDEVTLVGSRCGPFAPALRLLEHGLVDPQPLIDARYLLSESELALAKARQPGVLKVLLECADMNR